MSLTVQLLGPPRIERDGVAMERLRSNKAWGLLALLVRSQVPPSRERVASLLFPETDDPLGSLRWTLSILRRHLGDQADLGGAPLRLRLPPGTLVDVEVLEKGSWLEAIALPGLGHELLDGLVFRASAGFEIWLENERRHVAGTASAVLHHAALALLARGDSRAAVDRAAELVRLNPYDENAYVLLVRCLRASGDPDAASRHVEKGTEILRRELGVEPTPALRAAAFASEMPVTGRVSHSADVRAHIEAGEAALAAGAVDAGLHRLRAAVVAARGMDEPALLSRALVWLGGALVHSARGTDEEGIAALHEGTTLAEQADDSGVAAMGWREISWVQFLRAHYERADESLDLAFVHADGDERELAWVDLIRGACRHDIGDYPSAGELLRSAVVRARKLGKGQPLAQALTLLGRYHLLRGEMEDGVHLLEEAVEEVEARGMTAFLPWPESFLGEISLVRGDVAAAEARFDTRSPSAAWSATRAGRGSPFAAWVSSPPSAGTSIAPSRRSWRRRGSAAACPTHTCGLRHTPWTPSVPLRSSIKRSPRPDGSTSSRRSPRVGGSGSWSVTPPHIGPASENPVLTLLPGRSRRRSRIPHWTVCSRPPADGPSEHPPAS